MRKVLISILVVLLIVLAYFTIFQGISMGSINILSVEGIVNLNDELTYKIEEANAKIKNDLQNKQNELSAGVDTLLQNKESYYKLANVSTETEISKANTEEVYNIEYLWLRIGRHARNEGVNIVLDVINGETGDSSIKNLSFSAVGKYVGIIDFVAALEDDSELAFRIENFKLVPEGDNLKATFNVNGVRIKLENTTQTVTETTTPTTGENTNNDTVTNDGTTKNTIQQ